MKKIVIIVQLLTFLLLLAGCQSKPTQELQTLPIEPELFRYEGTQKTQSVAVDKDGLLYTVYYTDATDNLEEGKEVIQHFKVYDLEGTCLKQVDIPLGHTMIHDMVIEDTTLYCVVHKRGMGNVLYAIDLTTWETTEIAVLEDYSGVDNIILLGDYYYIFGTSELAADKEYELHPQVESFNYNQEVIGRISRTKENPQIEFLAVDFPIEVFKTNKDTIMIYQYTEENGLGFLEFNPQEETLQEVSWRNNSSSLHNVTSCEDGYLFINNTDMLYYGTVDGIEAHIATDDSLVSGSVAYVKGYVFYYDFFEDIVERVCITDILKENKEIRLLINRFDTNWVYGCGYQMKKEEVDMETFSLKVLAQDADFDLYLLRSGDSNSYNIKEKGAFYPLNDVEGVQEYLDTCFPYLKEMAINEDEDIWMIPVELRIPGIFYNKEYCEAQGIDFSIMDYKELIAFTEYTELEESGKISSSKMISEFFAQYLGTEESFDTELFRSYAKQLKSLYEKVGTQIYTRVKPVRQNKVLQGEFPDFFYEYQEFRVELLQYEKDIEELGVSNSISIMEVPKIAEGLKNYGTCTLFAVNPQSSNLEATLAYLSDLCRYFMTQENSLLLADKMTYTNTPFMQACYELYENGAIYFAMDSEVYMDTFYDYLEGKIELEEMVKEIERKRELYLGE